MNKNRMKNTHYIFILFFFLMSNGARVVDQEPSKCMFWGFFFGEPSSYFHMNYQKYKRKDMTSIKYDIVPFPFFVFFFLSFFLSLWPFVSLWNLQSYKESIAWSTCLCFFVYVKISSFFFENYQVHKRRQRKKRLRS